MFVRTPRPVVLADFKERFLQIIKWKDQSTHLRDGISCSLYFLPMRRYETHVRQVLYFTFDLLIAELKYNVEWDSFEGYRR